MLNLDFNESDLCTKTVCIQRQPETSDLKDDLLFYRVYAMMARLHETVVQPSIRARVNQRCGTPRGPLA